MHLRFSPKLPFKHILYLLLILFIFPVSLQYPKIPNKNTTHKMKYIKKIPGHEYFVVPNGGSMRLIDINMNEEMSVIVEFNERPLFISQTEPGLKKTTIDTYRKMQSAFSQDLGRLHESACRAYSVKFSLPVKIREYYKVFNGAQLKLPRAMLSEIYSLPYVKKVYMDAQVKALLKEAVHLIKADTLWTRYNNQGDSVRIGIIDSGIDYLHPALGKGIGTGFKVTGGYDFVNNDNDPMDDNGHGTHVACIAAGNSDILKGVAPKALLTAYKVLNSVGIGTSSDIVAAIERCADPDGDDDMSDRLDVVNMSLGEDHGDPFDGMTQAVNNAVTLGMVFCIAAGNNGEYASIGSPGTAELAITVGATDKQDRLAAFSSAGPVKKTYIMKPEILAPGDSIYSAIRSGEYEEESGTSMAAPVVAGVCALLKRQHKGWTPAMIKSAILSTAKDCRLNIMSQGAGRIDALKAIEARTLSVPPQLNYGISDSESGQWTTSDTIIVMNTSAEKQDYIVCTGSLPPAVIISSDMNSFSLLAGKEQRLIITLTVNTSIVQTPDDKAFSFGGKLFINGTHDTLAVPWAFVKSPMLMLSFKKPFISYFIYNSDKLYPDYRAWNSTDSTYSEILLPAGQYGVAAIFSAVSNGIKENRFVLKQDIEVKESKRISIDPDEAGYSIILDGVDEKNEKLNGRNNVNSYYLIELAAPKESGWLGISGEGGVRMKTTSLPSIVNIYASQSQIDTRNEKVVRLIQFRPLKGMNENIILTNSSEEFIKQNVNIDLGEDTMQVADILISGWSQFEGGGFCIPGEMITERVWKGRLYATRDWEWLRGYNINVISRSRNDLWDRNWESGSIHIISKDSIVINYGNYISRSNMDLYFSDGPVYHSWYVLNDPLHNNKPNYMVHCLGKYEEEHLFNERSSEYIIYDSQGKIVQQGILSNFNPNRAGRGEYTGEMSSDYSIDRKLGRVRMKFGLSLPENIISPALCRFRLLNSEGIPVSRLKKGDKGKLVLFYSTFNSEDADTQKIKVFIKKSTKTVWEELPKTFEKINRINSNSCTADIAKYANCDSSFFDVKIIIPDTQGRTTELLLEPAFSVGENIASAIAEEGAKNAYPEDYSIENIYPNPFNSEAVISCSLPEKLHVSIKVFDILGREVTTLLDDTREAGRYKIKFDGSGFSSGIYFCQIRAGNYVKTIKMILQK